MTELKTCHSVENGGCGETYPIGYFSVKKSKGKAYRSHYCKKCTNRRRREAEESKAGASKEESVGLGQKRIVHHDGPEIGTIEHLFFCKIQMSQLAHEIREEKRYG